MGVIVMAGIILNRYHDYRKFKGKRKQKVSHWSCRRSYWNNEIIHDHYIQSTPNSRCKTHDYRYSLYRWMSGYKFFEWVIKPFKMNFKTRHIFDRTRFILNHNFKFKLGAIKQ